MKSKYRIISLIPSTIPLQNLLWHSSFIYCRKILRKMEGRNPDCWRLLPVKTQRKLLGDCHNILVPQNGNLNWARSTRACVPAPTSTPMNKASHDTSRRKNIIKVINHQTPCPPSTLPPSKKEGQNDNMKHSLSPLLDLPCPK